MRTLSLLLVCLVLPVAASAQFSSPTVCWDFEEASGTRAPTTGTSNLSVTGSVPSAAGKSGNAADFSGNNADYLSAADNAELSVSDQDFSWAAWVWFDSTAGTRTILQKDSSLTMYGMFYLGASDEWKFVTSFNNEAVLIGTTPGTGTWYLVAGYHDTTNNLNGISFNGGSFTTGASASNTSDEANAFCVGGSCGSLALDGRIDMLVFWKGYVLTAGNVTTLNGGAGTCADITGGGGGATPSDGGLRLRGIGQ